MRSFGRLWTWYTLLNKRLMKKYSFLLILCMVPCLIVGFRLAAGQDNHILRIALYAAEGDAAGRKVTERFLLEGSIIGFETVSSPDMAEELLRQGRVDAAWIFEESLDECLKTAAGEQEALEMVKVLQREDTMQLRLARVKLYTGIYPHYVYAVYEDFVRNRLGGAADCSEEELRYYFDATYVEDSIFEMRYMDTEQKVEEGNDYLLSPLRGILALWLMLVGMASAMYFLQDEKNGVFDWIPVGRRYPFAWGYHLVPLSDAAVVMLLAQYLTGSFVSFRRELLCSGLFVLTIIGFCSCLQMVCRQVERLGSLIPVLMVGMLALCPVFLDLRRLRLLQNLLPPYHYLRSLHDKRSLADMTVYAVTVTILGLLISRIRLRSKTGRA